MQEHMDNVSREIEVSFLFIFFNAIQNLLNWNHDILVSNKPQQEKVCFTAALAYIVAHIAVVHLVIETLL